MCRLVRMSTPKEQHTTIELMDPKSLTPYAKNQKVHPQEQVDKLAGLIAAFGFDQPIVVDGAGVIIKGHGRHKAALKLGLAKVPVIVRDDLDEYQVMAARISDNKIVSLEYDKDMLAFDVGTLARQENFNMELTGMGAGEMETMLAHLELELKDSLPDKTAAARSGSRAEGAPEPGPVSEMEGELDGGGGAKVKPAGQPVIQYNLIFDDEAQQQRWYRFTRWLKQTYPEAETVASRLDCHLVATYEADEAEADILADEAQ